MWVEQSRNTFVVTGIYSRMDDRTIGYLLHVWVVVAVLVGIGIIIFTSSTLLTRLSTVLIILGLVSLMPAFKFTWWGAESAEQDKTGAAADESTK